MKRDNNSPLDLHMKLPALKPRLRKTFHITASEFVKTTARLEQQFGFADYHIPKNYPPTLEDKTPRFTVKRDTKHRYIDDLILKGKKAVGPGAYKPCDFGRFMTTEKETHFAYARAPRLTFIDQIQKREKQ